METVIQVLIAVGFIVYSIYSEVSKHNTKSGSEDFSDLGSIDDFFKKQSGGSSGTPQPPSSFAEMAASSFEDSSSKDKRRKKKRGKSPTPPKEVRRSGGGGFSPSGFDSHPSLEGQASYDDMPSPYEANFDALPTLMQQASHPDSSHMHEMNFDQLPSMESQAGNDTHALQGTLGRSSRVPPSRSSAPRKRLRLDFGPNELIRGIVLSEILRRYDMNRVFERIPQFRRKDMPSE